MTEQARIAPEIAKATTRDEVLGLALGAASTCWESLEGTGVFDSFEAGRILSATSARLTELDGTMRPGVISEVAQERIRQRLLGYSPEHDDEHGPQHLMEQVQQRVAGKLWTRDDLVEAAAVLVAAVEWFDRVADTRMPDMPQEATHADPQDPLTA